MKEKESKREFLFDSQYALRDLRTGRIILETNSATNVIYKKRMFKLTQGIDTEILTKE